MGWPKSQTELEREGYEFGQEDECRRCGAPIVWVKTPNDKNMPLEQDSGMYQGHIQQCGRGGGGGSSPPPARQPSPDLGKLFEEARGHYVALGNALRKIKERL